MGRVQRSHERRFLTKLFVCYIYVCVFSRVCCKKEAAIFTAAVLGQTERMFCHMNWELLAVYLQEMWNLIISLLQKRKNSYWEITPVLLMFVVEAVGEAPLWISCSAFLWKAIFKLSINQRQTLMYTPLCPWVFVALLCGPYFPSQTFVVSYSLHPLPLIGESWESCWRDPFYNPKWEHPFL